MNNVTGTEAYKKHSVEHYSQGDNDHSEIDPWSHISGDRALSNNPWRGKYDRRTKSRDIEEWIEFDV